MQIKKNDGTFIDLETVLDYRISPVSETGKPYPWYTHNDDTSVAIFFGISYQEIKKARFSDEWQQAASEFAESRGIEYKYVSHANSYREPLKKSDYEQIGRDVVDTLILRSQSQELEGIEYKTTKAWATKQVNILLIADAPIETRPQKLVAVGKAVKKEQQRAAAVLREKGVPEDIIKEVYS